MAEIEQLQEMLGLLQKQMGILELQVKAASERLVAAKAAAVPEASSVPPDEKPSRKGIGGRKRIHVSCGMPGCKEAHQARGLCASHYAAVRRAAMKAGSAITDLDEKQ